MEQPDDILALLEAATSDPASALHFTPVPVRDRHDGWSPDRQRGFVAGLALTGRVDCATALVGMTPQSAARLRRRPGGDSFALACSAASTLAKRARRARAEASKGLNGAPNFSPRGSSLSATNEPSAAPPPRWDRVP